MNNQLTTKLILLAMALASFSSITLADDNLTAKEIMVKVDERDTGDTSHRKLTMILIDKRGSQRKRNFTTLSKSYEGSDKSLTTFLSPADVKGTRFLSYEWADDMKGNDAWIYLPTLRKTKRIPSSDRTGAFLGSDFSFSDFEDAEVSYYDYKMIDANGSVDKIDSWLIERVPQPEIKARIEKQTGYRKELLWVSKDHFVVMQKKGWFKNNKIKYLKVTRLEIIDGIATDTKLQMTTTKNGQLQHQTIIIVNDIQYNQAIEDKTFTAAALKEH
ncbi:MAG: outer membrane lipoprotein-sorting protein [Gammaproteobacteria bacterium]|nr:outer membrane lipoprotein-sorting protein [Gammaproteobacteria bacterium]